MNSYPVSDQGWIPKIMQDLKNKVPCQITVSGNDAFAIVGKISHITSRFPFDHFPGVPKITLGNQTIDPLMLPLFVGSIGSFGAAGACVAYVLSMAHAAGYKISVDYDSKDPFNFMDDQLVFKPILGP